MVDENNSIGFYIDMKEHVGSLLVLAILLLYVAMLPTSGINFVYIAEQGAYEVRIGYKSASLTQEALLALFAASVALTALAHEAAHALALLVLGKRPKLGVFKLGLYISTESPYRKGEFLFAALSPILLSIAYLVAGMQTSGVISITLLMLYLMNTVGAAGDIYCCIVVLLAKDVKAIKDEGAKIFVEGVPRGLRAIKLALIIALVSLRLIGYFYWISKLL